MGAYVITSIKVSTHSRPKAAEGITSPFICMAEFQHTAARRRLALNTSNRQAYECFSTQPPEGGCSVKLEHKELFLFQHTAARRRLQSRLDDVG